MTPAPNPGVATGPAVATPKPPATDDDRAARRRADALDIGREAREAKEREEMAREPVPVGGLLSLAEMLRADDRLSINQARAVRASEEWQRLDPTERAVCAEWLKLGVKAAWKTVIFSQLGHVDRSGRWHDAELHEPALVDSSTHVEKLADAPDHEPGPPPDTLDYLAARPEVSVLAAAPKVGKSTWVRGQVARATRDGESILVLTEESAGLFRRQMRKRGADLSRLHAVYLRTLPTMTPAAFRAFVEQAIKATGAGTLVLDTWRKVLSRAHPKGAEGEADSGVVDDVVGWLASLDRAVLIAHHCAKWTNAPHEVHRAGGDVFDAIRGSGGLLAAVDRALVMFPEDGDRQNAERIVKVTARGERDQRDMRLAYDADLDSYLTAFQPACRPAGNGGAGGGAHGVEPTPDDILALLRKLPTGEWLARKKVIEGVRGNGRRWTDTLALLTGMVDAGTVEHRTHNHGSQVRHSYRLGERDTERVTDRPESVTEARESVTEAPGVGYTTTPIDFSSPPCRGGEKAIPEPAPVEEPAEAPPEPVADDSPGMLAAALASPAAAGPLPPKDESWTCSRCGSNNRPAPRAACAATCPRGR